jgi:hypothetical protein
MLAIPAALAVQVIPTWVRWLAQDADGTWWAYEAEPNQQHNGWYENEVGRILRLGVTPAPPNWQEMLIRLNPASLPALISSQG